MSASIWNPASVGTVITRNGTVNVKDYGAVGDGVVDDTAAIQLALDTGLDVYIPRTAEHYRISAALVGLSDQLVYGDGRKSYIKQYTTNLNVFSSTSVTNLRFKKLRLRAIGTKTALADGSGFAFYSSSDCSVKKCIVENHLGAGVNFYNTSDSTVERCEFLSSPATDGVLNNLVGADIQVVYNSSRNKVLHNKCTSGNGVGVYIQTITPGNSCDDNEVLYNYVTDCKAYGVMAYRNDDAYPSADSVRRTKIIGNTIRNTTGTIINAVTSTYTYGCAIYIQGAEETEAVDNIIKGTHAGAVTFAETLAPGAIGVTNQARTRIHGNIIEDAGMFGIDIGDPNGFGEPLGYLIASDNIITNCTRGMIHVRRRGNVKIYGNTGNTSGDSGIEISNTVQKSGISIIGNDLKNVTGTSAIELKYCLNVHVSDNVVDTNSTHGISADNCTGGQIAVTTAQGFTQYGIYITSTCADVDVRTAILKGTGTSSGGLRMEAPTRYSDIAITGCVDPYVGAYKPHRVLANNTANPSVKYSRDVVASNSSATTYSNFLDGEDGQDLTIYFTTANTTIDFSGSNIKGNGGTDVAGVPAGSSMSFRYYGAGVNVWLLTAYTEV